MRFQPISWTSTGQGFLCNGFFQKWLPFCLKANFLFLNCQTWQLHWSLFNNFAPLPCIWINFGNLWYAFTCHFPMGLLAFCSIAALPSNYSGVFTCLSTFYHCFINFINFLSTLSTFYQLYQLYQLFINFLSFSHFLSILSTFYQFYPLFLKLEGGPKEAHALPSHGLAALAWLGKLSFSGAWCGARLCKCASCVFNFFPGFWIWCVWHKPCLVFSPLLCSSPPFYVCAFLFVSWQLLKVLPYCARRPWPSKPTPHVEVCWSSALVNPCWQPSSQNKMSPVAKMSQYIVNLE